MKKHRRTRTPAAFLALLLCCLLAWGGIAPAALAVETEETLLRETASSSLEVEPDVSSTPDPGQETSSQPEIGYPNGEESSHPEESTPSTGEGEEDVSSSPEEGEPSQPEEGEEESSQPEEPEGPVLFTVTFRTSGSESVTVEVEEGQFPQVPELTPPPLAEFLGWADPAGQLVQPEEIPVTADTVYTARWSREVGDLLQIDTHITYIDGYSDGLFRPNKNVTRAEAANMLFKLLRSQDWEKKSFPDVSADAWYAGAVETLAGLGILNGYEDGTFKPQNPITRAEFVTMLMGFSTLQTGTPSFTDVPADFWASFAIYTAAQLGWVSGYGDGTFEPNDPITRAETVKLLNTMLGRTGDPNFVGKSDVKNFYDLFSSHWAYGAIVEASTAHVVQEGSSPEVWASYTADTTPVSGHWITDQGVRYYVDPATRKLARGQITIDGVKYRFDSSTCKPFTGFAMDGQWRRYYKNGAQQTDISGLGVVSGPYYIKVYKPANYLIIFAKDGSGSYNTPVRAMRVSCGNSTPTGTYYTPNRFRWLKMVGDTWAQWCTQIQGNYLFHSVPNWTLSNLDLEVEEYNRLGETRSLGCIRLNCEDAKWIYDNCALGTQVYISPTETSGPLSKPAGITLPSWHTWDPTDPTAYYMCDRHGCHQNLQK